MLAQLERTLPRGERWRYEPKFDGFRGLLWRTDRTVIQLLSRNVKALSPWFPEPIQAGKALPPSTVLDGEIVIADDQGWSDFGALQARLGIAKRDVAQIAVQRPAVLLCFELLTLAGDDLTMSPLVEAMGTNLRRRPTAEARAAKLGPVGQRSQRAPRRS